MKKTLFSFLVASFFLNVSSLTGVFATQQNGAQIDVAAVYQKALPRIKKIRKLQKAEKTFDARIYRRLRNGLRKGNYPLVSNVLGHIENIGGNKVDGEVEKLRTFLGNQGIALFQNPQQGGETLAAKTPVAIQWTGYAGGNMAQVGQAAPALSTPTLNPATAIASYSATPASVCSVNSATGALGLVGVGSCEIILTATPTDSSTHTVAKASATVTIGQGNQSAPTGNNIYGQSPALTVGETLAIATTPSGSGHGSLEYQSGDTSICTVDAAGTVTAKAPGTCAVKVRWVGDANYHPSPWHDILSITLTQKTRPVTIGWTGYAGGNVAKVGQAAPALSTPTLNPASATASYSATPGAVCTVNPTTGALQIKAAGSCEITLTATPADSAHTSQTASVTVTVGRGEQTVNFHLPYYYRSYADSYLHVGKFLTLRRTPTGGHTSLEYKSSNPGVCTVYSNSGHVSGNTTGSCDVQARWVENARYNASPWTTIHTFRVRKGEQAAPTGNNIYGNAPALAAGNTLSVATAPSGGGEHGTLEYQSTTTSVCTINGNTGVVTAKAVGACKARVRWRGNGNYNSSPWHDILSLTVGIGTQSDPSATHPYGRVASVSVGATLDIARPPSGGHGTLEYQSVDTGSCTVNDRGTVTGVSAAGNCTIQARWTGNQSFHPTSWATIATVTITETKQPGQGRYRLGEFGIYDSDDNLVIKTGALETPKRLVHLLDNPQKLGGFSASEKTYLKEKYNWTEDPSAPLTTLRIIDLRQYPRYGDEPRPKSTPGLPFVLLADNVIVDFIAIKVKTTPSRTRKEAIDKMFAWLVSPTPGVPRDRIRSSDACLNQHNVKANLTPINPVFSDDPSKLNEMRAGNTPSLDLARDMKTYLNSSNPYAGFYFVRATRLLNGRYQKFRRHLKDPLYNVENIKNTRSCQIKAEYCCYNEKTDSLKPLYGHIEAAFDYQVLQAILKDATTDADVLDLMAELVTPEAGKTEEERLSEIHGTVSFNFNFRDPSRGYVPDKNICYNSQNGPRTNIPYTKRWLLGILQRHVRQFAYARDWLNMYEWPDRMEREYKYALCRRR